MATEAQQRIHAMHQRDARLAALTYVRTTAGITQRMRDPAWKGMENARPGIEPFFINKADDAPTTFRGGALRQLPKDPKQSNRMVAFLLKRRAEQSKELRTNQDYRSAPDVITHLDEGKMELQSTIENIGLQVQQQLYTPTLISELKRLSLMLLKSAPLLDSGSIDAMAEYLVDVGDIINLSQKNLVKADAGIALGDLEDAELMEERPNQWVNAPAGGKDRQRLIELTYKRLSGMVDYLNKMSDIADRPIADKIRASQAFAREMAIKAPSDYAKTLRELDAKNAEEEDAANRVRAADPMFMPMGADGGRDIAHIYADDADAIAEMMGLARQQGVVPLMPIGEVEGIAPEMLAPAGEAEEDVAHLAALEDEVMGQFAHMSRITEAQFNELVQLYAPYAGLRGARIPRNLTVGTSPFMAAVSTLLKRIPGRRGYQAATEKTPGKIYSDLVNNFVVQYERGGRQIIAPINLNRAILPEVEPRGRDEEA